VSSPPAPDRDPASPLDDDELLLWRALGRVAQQLPRLVEPEMLRASGLSMTEFAVLDALASSEAGSLRVVDLAEAIGLSASRVSRVVDTLLARTWVERRKDASDARATLLSITPDGTERLESAAPHHARLARRHVLDHVPPSRRAALRRALDQIARD
jgi:DNA-binding MarR family transcriptional regulator